MSNIAAAPPSISTNLVRAIETILARAAAASADRLERRRLADAQVVAGA